MPYVQIMCLILKLAGNIGPKWAATWGDGFPRFKFWFKNTAIGARTLN
jgi:hypothetical protein